MARATANPKRAKRVENPFDRANNVLFIESDVWDTTTKWTPGDITTALANADGGTLETAADICDAQWADDRIRGTLQTRVGALLGLNNDEKLEFWSDSARIKKAIAKDWWISAPETELGKLIRWGLHLGVGVAQRKVVENDGRWIPRLQTWHPRALSFNRSSGLWSIRTADQGEIVIAPDDPHWILFMPYGEGRPWAEGTWRTVGLLWLIKTMGLRAWGKHNELHGSGGLKGKAPSSATPADLQGFWTQLKLMGRNARIVLPEGYELDVLEATGKTWETFPQAVDKADTGIAIVHLGQPMTTEVPKSAQTGADNARAVRQDYLEFDAENLATWAHDKHLPAWAAWNFGDALLAPYPRYNASPPINMQIEASALATLGNALVTIDAFARKQELVIDVRQLLFRYNVPFREMTAVEKKAAEPVVVEQPEPEQEEEEPEQDDDEDGEKDEG